MGPPRCHGAGPPPSNLSWCWVNPARFGVLGSPPGKGGVRWKPRLGCGDPLETTRVVFFFGGGHPCCPPHLMAPRSLPPPLWKIGAGISARPDPVATTKKFGVLGGEWGGVGGSEGHSPPASTPGAVTRGGPVGLRAHQGQLGQMGLTPVPGSPWGGNMGTPWGPPWSPPLAAGPCESRKGEAGAALAALLRSEPSNDPTSLEFEEFPAKALWKKRERKETRP